MLLTVAFLHCSVDWSVRPILMEKPDVVVGTPSRVLIHLTAQNLALQNLEVLVVDEADLLFSFGFEADVKNLLWSVGLGGGHEEFSFYFKTN